MNTAPAPGTQATFVDVGPVRMRVQRAGQGPPLLLINGLGGALEMWDPLVASVRGREVIAFDLPGAGESSRPRLPMGMRRLAATVSDLLRALQLPQADVLGCSFGGAVAQELAYRHPEQVRRLILCATTAGMPAVPPSPLVIALMLTPARYYSPALGARIVPRIAGGRTAREPAVLEAGLRLRQARPPSLLGYGYQLFAVSGWSSYRWLGRLRHEVLVVHGDDDRVAPLVNARLMARRLPNGRLVVIRGGGHLFLLDEPNKVLPTICRFLDAGGAEGAGARQAEVI